MPDRYRPLACDRHDYLEIACLFGYRLRIELEGGDWLEGRALTTRTLPNKEEILLIRVAGQVRAVRQDRLHAITPPTPGARFGRIELQP